MPNLKDIKTRIGSVKKTRQITSAMKLVAAAKLKRATDAATAAKPYKQRLEGVLRRVAASAGDTVDAPLLEPRAEVNGRAVVVLTSDRGLCGGFNNNLLRKTLAWANERRSESLALTVFGRKGGGFFARAGIPESDNVIEWGGREKGEMVAELCDRLVAGFVDGTYDEVWIVYNEFVNAITQVPTYLKLLPMALDEDDAADTGGGAEYRYEPGANVLLGELLPLYVRTLVLQTFLETEAGEFAARMTAMDNATNNASDLIKDLTLDYNRARQAAITKELIEIVSGAQALE
ncbi:MAG: F-type H+-transporting ATPase subunit gamma [Myxococcota bacterium]|jgi:F-type H+-transporting ATPase subunit gamma